MDDYNDAEQLAGVGGSALRGVGKIANAATRRLREKAIKKAKKESAAAIRKVAHLVKMVIAGLISILGPIGIIVLSFVVIIFMAFGATAGSSSSANGVSVGGSSQFVPRLTAPSTSNRYYYSTDNPFYPAYGMPNCTAYAFGRIYELNGSRPNLCTGNAEMWYDYNKSHNYYPYGSTPKLGAVAVWVHPGEVMLRLSKKLKTIQLHILTQRITVLIFILVLHHYPIRAMLEQLIGLYRDIYTHIHRLSAIQVPELLIIFLHLSLKDNLPHFLKLRDLIRQ